MKDSKHTPGPFNGMPLNVFHYHSLTPEGRTALRELREAKADTHGEPLEFVRWRNRKGRMWLYVAQSVHDKATGQR